MAVLETSGSISGLLPFTFTSITKQNGSELDLQGTGPGGEVINIYLTGSFDSFYFGLPLDQLIGTVTSLSVSESGLSVLTGYSLSVPLQDFVSSGFGPALAGAAGIEDVAGRYFSNVGAETLDTGAGADEVYSGKGADIIGLGKGNDTAEGGRGTDLIGGGKGNDRLFGQKGNDTLDGGKGNDKLFGGRGEDLLIAGGGDDTLKGGKGDDRLMANGGEDQLFGGGGEDLFDFNTTTSGDHTIHDFNVVEDEIVFFPFLDYDVSVTDEGTVAEWGDVTVTVLNVYDETIFDAGFPVPF